jgi:hypothetical protein
MGGYGIREVLIPDMYLLPPFNGRMYIKVSNI